MLEGARKYTMVPEWGASVPEEERPRGEQTGGAKQWDYLVSARELSQIKKHIFRAERARGLRDHKYRLFPQRTPSEKLPPKTLTPQKDERAHNVQKTPKAKPQKHQAAWAQEQMQKHQDRMARGRERAEQRHPKPGAQKPPAQAPPLLRARGRPEGVRELERVTAYPVAQPRQDAPMEVTVLMEKPKGEREVKKPLGRELLAVPPFLKSRLENKVKIS